VSAIALHPGELLDSHGFKNGLLCEPLLTDTRYLPAVAPRSISREAGGYASSRHLLRHLIDVHLLPVLPWAAQAVFYQDPHGSPVRLWLYDEEGCPLRTREQDVRGTPPILLGADDLRQAVSRVYPLRTSAQVDLYTALGLLPAEHETALVALAPFLELDDDVLALAAELYAPVRTHASPGVVGTGHGFTVRQDTDDRGRGDVLEIAGRLLDVVASARSLVN